MPRILHLFDVSPFIHAGKGNKYSRLERVIKEGSTWKTQVTPTGGISWLFNTLYEVVGTGDCVFCCDRNPTIKKDILPSYKSNRNHDDNVTVQKAVAEYILQQCNGTVLARAGYEADDIIFTLVKKLHNAYDEIYIYTGDSDLYFLVYNTVSIRPSSSRAKSVYRWNYEKVLENKGARYNTLTMQKIIKGDSSDCIPALPTKDQIRMSQVFYNDAMYEHLGDPEFVRQWTEYAFPELMTQVNLVFPLEVENIPDEFSQVDKNMVRNWGIAIKNKMFRGMPCSPDFDIKYYVEEMQNLGYYVEEQN